jgi:hypothetical protein
LGDSSIEFIGLYRLREVVVHACRQALVPIAGHGVRGHRDNRDMGTSSLLLRADGGCRLTSPHHGHLHIHQDQIKRLLFRGRERRLAVGGDDHRVALFLEHPDRQPLIHHVSFRQQDVETLPALGQHMAGHHEELSTC